MAEAETYYDKAKGEEEHILTLPDNRKVAYAHNGPPTSRTLVLFFCGIMSVGTAPNVPTPCRERGMHWIAPSLPGMGNSSTRRDKKTPYHVSFLQDMVALLSHLYPTDAYDTLYVSGGSYGTVQAQMLYGAPYDLFPPGRKIAGCVLLAGFSPLKYHPGYAKTLNWANWFSFGPPTQLLPWHLLQWLFRLVIGSKLKTLDGAKGFLRQTLVDNMDEDEKKVLTRWLEENALTEDAWLDQMARGTIRCCQNWHGFMEVSDVIHSDWGFQPQQLDEHHASKPVLVVGSSKDQIGGGTNNWLVDNYRSATYKSLPGGHISSLFYMDEIWRDIIGAVSGG
ncbi:uncharacterized protein A1O9_07744 [Exophiala aquamarina CBS 119918]|uniref:AB hydrolase-1 domain-containing protein n=1 Tax=Exophiala aquamarina CBS 119918 TaxID=1182545 RepID=A0A072PA70_9EURO|nr:uncharacterized protein A1O9_07744 [Exophiala aquamarina CBS 119918]KEF56163.1 hypothetical protein A1O9_07744 [Exophiala aquamarina CBS 119918]